MRKSLLALLTLSIELLILATPTGAITASQIGASQIVNTYNSENWAGVAYSVEWKSGFTNYWGPILWASESIYVGNLTLDYISYPNYIYTEDIGIWVGLSPAKIGYGTGSSSGSEQTNFIQAGFDINVGSYVSINYFVTTLVNGQLIYNNESYVPAGKVTYLDVFLNNLGNGTALAQLYVFYANGTYWTKEIYTSIPWTKTGSAMSIVEAPSFSTSGPIAELPYVSGGMIHFTFAYVGSDGNEHIGPSNNPVGNMYADVYILNEPSTYNVAQAQIYNGWANNNGGWDYLYQFFYPEIDQTTYGL